MSEEIKQACHELTKSWEAIGGGASGQYHGNDYQQGLRTAYNQCAYELKEMLAGVRKPATSKTTTPSTLASATGSVEWEPEAHKPPSYTSVLVYGILECEHSPDTHEGYWDGKKWQSVRRDDDISALRKLKLLNVTYWACRPTPPNAEVTCYASFRM